MKNVSAISAILGIIFMFVGVVGLWSAPFLWGGHAIYELIKTDQGFFTIFFSNFGLWVAQMLLSGCLLLIARVAAK